MVERIIIVLLSLFPFTCFAQIDTVFIIGSNTSKDVTIEFRAVANSFPYNICYIPHTTNIRAYSADTSYKDIIEVKTKLISVTEFKPIRKVTFDFFVREFVISWLKERRDGVIIVNGKEFYKSKW